MDTNVTPEILRRKAAANGLILGLFTAACRLASESVASGGAGAGTAVLTWLLWLVQFIGCIRIMKSLMEKLVRQYPDAGNEDTAKYGRLLALASSIIFSAAMFFDLEFIHTDMAARQMDIFYEIYGNSLDSNTRSALQTVEDHYSQIIFVSTLVYSWLYGIILSAILSRNIPRKDPFASYMNKND